MQLKSTKGFWIGLSLIVLLGSLFRFYNLGSLPYGYTWDEAAITYDGWGISLWHRDQFATFMPLTFKSFGDYKAPGLIYLLGAVFKILPMSDLAIRIISATSGTLLILCMAGIAYELFKRKDVAIATALVTAVAPWSIHLSRIGYEANVAITCVAAGIYLFLLGRRNGWWYLVSALAFSVSIYMYQSTKIVTPLILLCLVGLFRPQKHIVPFILAAALFVVSYLPIGLRFDADSGERARQSLLFWEQGQLLPVTDIVPRLVLNTVKHVSLGFWIGGTGDEIRHVVPGYGIMYGIDFLFVVIGLILLWKHERRIAWLVIVMMLISLLPSIMSRVSPHTLRSANILIPVYLVVGYGALRSIRWLHSRFKWLPILAYGVSLGLFLRYYTTTYAIAAAPNLQYGYKEALLTAREELRTAERMVVTDFYGQPYIYTLLYFRYTPEEFQFGALANVMFRPIRWPEQDSKTIYIGTPQEIPVTDPHVVKVITIPGTTTPTFVVARL